MDIYPKGTYLTFESFHVHDSNKFSLLRVQTLSLSVQYFPFHLRHMVLFRLCVGFSCPSFFLTELTLLHCRFKEHFACIPEFSFFLI